MDLPVRILQAAPREPVISVDGAFGAPGLNLSHWPGNTTPLHLKHDLSTGSALAFARLEEDERIALAGDAAAIVNNHYDTDGVCAMFAARHPQRALPLEERLLAAARAGDFYRAPDEDALAVDAIVTGLSDPLRSPLRAELEGLDELGRWERAQAHLIEFLPAILMGERRAYRALFEPALGAFRADRSDLAGAERSEEPGLDLTIWAARERASSRDTAPRAFDPGRHALFGSTRADRVLVLGTSSEGTTARLILSTLSWFDLTGAPRLSRPDLGALAASLDEIEGSAPGDGDAWRCQPRENASPELWFGRAELEPFAEHSDALRPSRLAPDLIRQVVRRALAPRASST